MSTLGRPGPNPRDDPAAAQQAFESMSDSEWSDLWDSPGVPYGLTLAEQHGLSAAIATRIRRRSEQQEQDG